MKITKRSVVKFTTVLIEGIEIGQIKLNAEVQIASHEDGSDCDFDLLDYDEITYMNMKVENIDELFKFHKTLVINLQSEIQKAIDKLLTDEVVNDIINSTAKAVTYN